VHAWSIIHVPFGWMTHAARGARTKIVPCGA
jgi:hypothetical protein